MSTPGVMGDGAQLALARSLVQALENGDQARAAGVLARLGAEREAELFRQVGRLTRALHDALRDTRLQSRLADLAAQDLPDARERLAQAAGRSEDAARRVGAVLDAMLVRACELERRMRARIDAPDAAGSAAQDAEPAQWEAIRACASRLQADLAEMRLLQDVQDTGGQVLRTVLQLVQEVDSRTCRTPAARCCEPSYNWCRRSRTRWCGCCARGRKRPTAPGRRDRARRRWSSCAAVTPLPGRRAIRCRWYAAGTKSRICSPASGCEGIAGARGGHATMIDTGTGTGPGVRMPG